MTLACALWCAAGLFIGANLGVGLMCLFSINKREASGSMGDVMTGAYERPEICATCKQICCEDMPGIMWPEDVLHLAASNNMAAALYTVLSTGNYAIDWWCGDPRGMSADYSIRAYYVRPRLVGHSDLFDPTWDSGPCVLWNTDTGCTLPAHNRPRECRTLEPKPGRECVQHGSGKQAAAIAWWPWRQTVGTVGHSLEAEK